MKRKGTDVDTKYRFSYFDRKFYCYERHSWIPRFEVMEEVFLGARIYNREKKCDATEELFAKFISQKLFDQIKKKSLAEMKALFKTLPKGPPDWTKKCREAAARTHELRGYSEKNSPEWSVKKLRAYYKLDKKAS